MEVLFSNYLISLNTVNYKRLKIDNENCFIFIKSKRNIDEKWYVTFAKILDFYFSMPELNFPWLIISILGSRHVKTLGGDNLSALPPRLIEFICQSLVGISSPHVPMRSGDPEYRMKYDDKMWVYKQCNAKVTSEEIWIRRCLIDSKKIHSVF